MTEYKLILNNISKCVIDSIDETSNVILIIARVTLLWNNKGEAVEILKLSLHGINNNVNLTFQFGFYFILILNSL